MDLLLWFDADNLCFNSLAPRRSEYDSKNVIFNLDLLTGIYRSSYDNALRWMSLDLTDDKSTLVQVMAWCRQATSHYLDQCWLSSLSPSGVARPQWVNTYWSLGEMAVISLNQCWTSSIMPYCITTSRPQWVNQSHCHPSENKMYIQKLLCNG